MAPSRKDQRKAISAIRGAKLQPGEIEAEKLLRISAIRHTNGLGFNKNAESRFSDPRAASGKAVYGVIYLSTDFATCVAETIVRDRKDGVPGLMPMSRKQAVDDWQVVRDRRRTPAAPREPEQCWPVLARRADRYCPRFGSRMSQKLSRAIYQNASGFDGILYKSRFLMGECVAIFDRAIPKLRDGCVAAALHSDGEPQADLQGHGPQDHPLIFPSSKVGPARCCAIAALSSSAHKSREYAP